MTKNLLVDMSDNSEECYNCSLSFEVIFSDEDAEVIWCPYCGTKLVEDEFE